MLTLELTQLGCRVEGRSLFSNVSLRLEGGECLYLHGPNGSGKTTLLDCVFGLRPIHSGACMLTTRGIQAEITKWPARRRMRAGFRRVFQKSPILPQLTSDVLIRAVRSTVAAAPRTTDESGVARLIASVEAMPGLANTYSFGQTRLCLAALAFASHGDVLLLDEPFEGLSPENKDLVELALLDKLRAGRIVIVADHDVTRGARIASQALDLDS